MASYFQSPLGMNHVPNFLRASSSTGLRRLMLINNRKHKGFVKYFNIQWVDNEERWYAWYFVTEETAQLEQTLRGEVQEGSE